MKVLKAHPIKCKHELKPGKIAKSDEDNLLIAGLDGYLAIEVLQLSSWGIFNPKEFYFTFSPTEDEELT